NGTSLAHVFRAGFENILEPALDLLVSLTPPGSLAGWPRAPTAASCAAEALNGVGIRQTGQKASPQSESVAGLILRSYSYGAIVVGTYAQRLSVHHASAITCSAQRRIASRRCSMCFACT